MIVDLRLAIPAACAWVASAVFVAAPAIAGAIGLWALAGVVTCVALSRRQFAIVAVSAAAAAFCCTSIALQAPGRMPEALVEAASSGRNVELVATATETVMPGQESFEVRIDGAEGESISVAARAFGESPSERIGIGSTIAFSATLTTAEPGEHVGFLVFPSAPPVLVAPPPWYLEWANSWRESFLATTSTLAGDGGDLLAGLAIGDTSAVSEDLDSAMKSSSLSHLTAVSGANCAIVIGLVMAAGAAIGLSRRVRIGASVAVLLAFVVLVTPEPSVLRAAVMAALVLVAMWSGRPVRGVPVLSLATLSLLLIDPWLARNFGFVLSVLATAGLLLLAGPLASVLERWMPRWIALVIAVPVAAQLACQPVIILLNAQLPTYGVVANILAAPAAPVATVVGLAACALLAVLPPLGEVLCLVAWLPSAWIAAVAQFFSTLPGAQLPWPEGWLGVLLLVAISVLLVFAIIGRRLARFGLAGAVITYSVFAIGGLVASHVGRPHDWQIAMCDVGQGDAIVVRSEGKVALFDTGPDPALLTACLADLGIDRIDLLVLTHFHLDHYGGLAAVASRVDVAIVGPGSDAQDDALVDTLVAGGAEVHDVRAAPSGLLGELRWTVLWPPRNLAGIELGNPSSIAVELEPVGDCARGCLSALFLGDLGESSQARLLAAHPLGEVDVVKVAHHGSADQDAELYARLHAVVGLVCVGVDNGYGHPAQSLLDILAGSGTSALRTDVSGLVLVAPGESRGTVRVWTSR